MNDLTVDLRKAYSGDALKPLSVMQNIMTKLLSTAVSNGNAKNTSNPVDKTKETRDYYNNAPKRGSAPRSISRELAARGNLW